MTEPALPFTRSRLLSLAQNLAGPRLFSSAWLGLTGLMMMSLFAFFKIGGFNLGVMLMLLAFLLREQRLDSLRDPLVASWLVFAGYVLLNSGWTLQQYPQWNEDIFPAGRHWLWLAGAFLPAFWMRQGRALDLWAFHLAITGLLSGIILFLFDNGLAPLFDETLRSGFHLKKPIALSLYAFVGILFMALLGKRIAVEVYGSSHRLQRLGFSIYHGLAALLLLQIFIVTQSRGSWLALLVMLLVALLLILLRHPGGLHRNGYKIAVALVILGTVVLLNFDTISTRASFNLDSHWDALRMLLGMPLDGEVQATSATSRLAMWHYGIESWLASPWFGIGPGLTTHSVFAELDTRLVLYSDQLDHFHNFYLQILVELGVVGFVLFAVPVALVMRRLIAHRHQLDRARWYFVQGIFGFLLVWSLFDFRAHHWDWRAFWFLWFAMAARLAYGIASPTAAERH